MAETSTEDVRLVAVTNVAFDGASHAPDAVFQAPADIARELIAAGGARLHEAAAGGDLEDVNGIGPRTAQALAGAGVADLEALASLDDDALAAAAEAVNKDADAVAAWRREARELRAS